MTAQDTENQVGGAEPAEDATDAPAPAGEGQQPEDPQEDATNPADVVYDSAIQFILNARRNGIDPEEKLKEILEQIRDK